MSIMTNRKAESKKEKRRNNGDKNNIPNETDGSGKTPADNVFPKDGTKSSVGKRKIITMRRSFAVLGIVLLVYPFLICDVFRATEPESSITMLMIQYSRNYMQCHSDTCSSILIELRSYLRENPIENDEIVEEQEIEQSNEDKQKVAQRQQKIIVTSIWDQIVSCFQRAKVSKKDATEFEKVLQTNLHYKNWHGKSSQATYERVKGEKLEEFFKAMSKAYGWGKKFEEQVDLGGLFSEKWQHKLLDLQFTPDETSNLRYGMIGMSKYPDSDHVAIAYVEYGVDFEFAPQVMEKLVKEVKEGFFRNSIVQKIEKSYGTPTMDETQIDRLTNYFRYKALKTFVNEGFLEGPINDENELKEVPKGIDIEN